MIRHLKINLSQIIKKGVLGCLNIFLWNIFIFAHAAGGVGPLIHVLYSMFSRKEQQTVTCSAQDIHMLDTPETKIQEEHCHNNPHPSHPATKCLHVLSTSALLTLASEENNPECPAQACPRLLLLSYLPTTVNKCNVCQGCDSHPLEGNRSMSHLTKDKPGMRLSSLLSLLCTSLASSWPVCRLLSQKSLKILH